MRKKEPCSLFSAHNFFQFLAFFAFFTRLHCDRASLFAFEDWKWFISNYDVNVNRLPYGEHGERCLFGTRLNCCTLYFFKPFSYPALTILIKWYISYFSYTCDEYKMGKKPALYRNLGSWVCFLQLKDMDDNDMLTLVIQEMSKEFPTLMETLVHERDQ